MSPLGRYSRIDQGASPGLFVIVYLLSPFRGGTYSAHWVCVVAVHGFVS